MLRKKQKNLFLADDFFNYALVIRDVILCQIKGSDVQKQTSGWFERSHFFGSGQYYMYIYMQVLERTFIIKSH